MKDIYLMNKFTGELKPATEAIRDFCATHDWRERWTDEWEETELEVENSELAPPDFTAAIR